MIEELLRLYGKNGAEVNMETLSLFGLRLTVPSPLWIYETVDIEGKPGVTVIDKTLGPRNLTAQFYTKTGDYIDSLKVRNDIYAFLMDGDHFYIGEKNVKGKRWKVRANEWTPERLDVQVQTFEIPLVADSGTSETVQMYPHVYTTPKFGFNNTGTVPIDMTHQTDTEIIFKGVSSKLKIINHTTGDVWEYDESTTAEDVISIKGVGSTKNNTSIYGRTNRKVLRFAIGWNNIEVVGATNFTLEINTRFYFL